MTFNGGGGACTPTPDPSSYWQFKITGAQVRAADPATGGAWDADGSAPDPYVCVQVTGYAAQCSSYLANTLAPAWNFTVDAYPWNSLGNVTITVKDSDLEYDDLIDIYNVDLQNPWAGVTLPETFDHSQTLSAGTTSLSLVVLPSSLAATAPLQVSWVGASKAEHGQLQLTGRVHLAAPLHVPLNMSVELPPGVSLHSGPERFTIESSAKLGDHDTPFVFDLDGVPAEDIKLVADVQTKAFGLHAVDEYRFGRPEATGYRPPPDGPEIVLHGHRMGKAIKVK
jgi:hypothetical protein